MNLGHIDDKGIVAAGVLQDIGKVLSLFLVVFQAIPKRLLPGIAVCADPAHKPFDLPCIIPGDEIVFVTELPIKGGAGIAAVRRDLPDGDLVNLPVFRCLSLHKESPPL